MHLQVCNKQAINKNCIQFTIKYFYILLKYVILHN